MTIKVGVLTSVHPTFDVRIFHKECKSLQQAGYDVTLIAQHDRDEVVDGVKILGVQRAKNRLGRMTRTVCQIYQRALILNADIYHFHDPELIPIGLLLRMRKKKVIYDVHEDIITDTFSKDYIPKSLQKMIGYVASKVENLTSSYFSGIVCVTPTIEKRFGLHNVNTFLVQNFPPLTENNTEKAISWNKREPVVAYVGGITEQRGIYAMIEAMGLLPTSCPIRLKLIGAFSSPTLKMKVSQLTGWSRVDELGQLPRDEVDKWLSQVRVGLVLLRPTPAYLMSQPIKLFEYMAAGIPVIASNFELWQSFVERTDCGVCVDPEDPQAIAEAIMDVTQNEERAKRMGEQGRSLVAQRYNWNHEEQTLLQLYKKITE